MPIQHIKRNDYVYCDLSINAGAWTSIDYHCTVYMLLSCRKFTSVSNVFNFHFFIVLNHIERLLCSTDVHCNCVRRFQCTSCTHCTMDACIVSISIVCNKMDTMKIYCVHQKCPLDIKKDTLCRIVSILWTQWTPMDIFDNLLIKGRPLIDH